MSSRIAAIALLSLMPLGCAISRTISTDSAADSHAKKSAEYDFWDAVAERSTVTNDDALQGLLLVAGDPAASDYTARLQRARERGWVSSSAELPKNESAEVGTIARATCEILDIRGGLTMRITGLTGRYCTRELIHLGILPPRTANQSMSGLEFVDLVGRIEDRKREREDLP
jgi:hypothetical protein